MPVLLFSAHRGGRASVTAFAMACVLLLVFAAFAAATPPGPEAGQVRLVKDGGSGFDRFTSEPTPELQRFMRERYSRMVVFSPYFDQRLSWYPDGWAYKDLYGMFPDSGVAHKHPKWILRGKGGESLYVPFDCWGSGCPQYAGDITNPSFRRAWIRGARRVMRRGYKGLYIDDVNMIRRVGDGTGREVTPFSPRTGKSISRRKWRRAVARFTRQIRRALPRAELVHNLIWFSPRPRDRVSRMQIRSADIIGLERGVNDAGLTPGGGPFGLNTYLRYVDWLHAQGRPVLFDENAPSLPQQDYGLAGYFLINDGRDYLASEPHTSPDANWRPYAVRLGAPHGPRYSWRGLLRRYFANGVVLLNGPGQAQRTVTLERALASGQNQPPAQQITPGAASGAVLVQP